MSIPILARNRGGSFAAGPAAPSGVTYDEDAQTYFDALEAASGWSEPADYADKKLAISNYFTNLKEDSNFTDVKAMYIPIWRAAGPNAINAVNPSTYDLTFNGTITHNGGDYIYGDASTGIATAGFQGPNSSGTKFFGVADFSYGGNVLDQNGAGREVLCGWQYEGGIYPYYASTLAYATAFDYAGWISASDSAHEGLYVMQSIDLTESYTTAGEFFLDGVSKASGQFYVQTISSTSNNWGLLAGSYSTPIHYSKYHVNFAFAGTELTSVSAFNTDTATFLAAI
tara:strand:- start:3999 stop:4850 length:852 start_codon:yes stop_codon:yes gene_type:complete